MTNENLIQILIGIIGTLIAALVSFFIYVIMRDIAELKDMFVRHVRDGEIHLPRERKHKGDD